MDISHRVVGAAAREDDALEEQADWQGCGESQLSRIAKTHLDE